MLSSGVLYVNLIIFIIYVFVLGFISSYLDKKYKIIDRLQDRTNKKFKRLVNLISIISLIIVLFLSAFESYFKPLGINITYLQFIFGIPFLLRLNIGSIISEKNRMKKEEYKHRHVEINFCYYCGSELNGRNICPSCGKQLEL
jgi:hypothetical protein